MAKESEADRRRFLRDLESLADAVAQPLGTATKPAPRARHVQQDELTWQVRVEPEGPEWPRLFRLTWGVRVPGILERIWPPGSREAKRVRIDYDETLLGSDVEQLRSGNPRIYKYRLGPRPSMLGRLNPLKPDLTLPLPEMSAALAALVAETVAALMPRLRTREDLADWLDENGTVAGFPHSPPLRARVVEALRAGEA